jgi:hypothetical protein
VATLTVKQDGSGDHRTLTDAFAAANTNDTIEIQDSETYNEGNLSRIKAGLTIKAGAGYTPILDGGDSLDCAIKFYNNWIIDGLTIRNYDGTATSGAGLISVAGNRVVHIKNCTIYNLKDSAITGLKNGSTVESCTIYNIHTAVAARAIDSGTQSATINNCLIYDVIHDGIQSTPSDTVIHHCTLYNVGFGAGSGGYGIVATLGTVRYNIVIDPNHSLTAGGIRAATTTYNCVSGAEGAAGGNYHGGSAGTGDIELDALLVSGSFTLSSASPCRGAADGSPMTASLDGTSREWEYDHKVLNINVGGDPDMGCFDTAAKVTGVNTDSISKVTGVEEASGGG